VPSTGNVPSVFRISLRTPAESGDHITSILVNRLRDVKILPNDAEVVSLAGEHFVVVPGGRVTNSR
jgi:hypothetical protein